MMGTATRSKLAFAMVACWFTMACGSSVPMAFCASEPAPPVQRMPLAPALTKAAAFPKADAHIEHPMPTIARLRPQFRRCFEARGVDGRLDLWIAVGPGGHVEAVRSENGGQLPRDVVRCIEARAMRAVFDEPEGGKVAVLPVPVAYFRQ